MANAASTKQDQALKTIASTQLAHDDLNAFQQQASDNEGQLEVRTSKLEELTRSIGIITAGLRNNFASIKKRADEHQQLLDSVEPSVEQLEWHTVELTSQAEDQANTLQSLDQRVRANEGAVDELQADNKEVDADIQFLVGQNQEIRQRVADTEDALAALQQGQLNTEDELNALRHTTQMLLDTDEEQADEIEDLSNRVQIAELSHSGLQDAHNRLAAHLSNIEQQTRNLGDSYRKGSWIAAGGFLLLVIAAITTYTMNSGNYTLLHEQFGQQQATIADNHIQTGKTIEAVANAVNSLEARHSSAMETISVKLDSNDESIASLQASLDVSKRAIEAINARIYASDEALRGSGVDFSSLKTIQWVEQQDPTDFSIQIASAYNKRPLADFISRYGEQLGSEKFSWIETTRNGRDWFVLLYGVYAYHVQAQSVLDALPDEVLRSSPYIRTISGIIDSARRD